MSAALLTQLRDALTGVLIGQPNVISDLVTAFIARGHVLLEGVPGTGKTLLAKTCAQALGLDVRRVQFTPDLMPADLLGTSVYQPDEKQFRIVRGPLFTQVLIADEINRTPPKTQAALLEAMEERQVSLEGRSHPLDAHFFVVATQNPLELEGTYPLPEAQLDRFMMRIRVGYPSERDEQALVTAFHLRHGRSPHIARVLGTADITTLQAHAAQIHCDATLVEYAVRLARATRDDARVRLGASPRAAQALLSAAKARATIEGSDFALPDHVKQVAPSVLNHRLLLTPEAEVEGTTPDDVVADVLASVAVPR